MPTPEGRWWPAEWPAHQGPPWDIEVDTVRLTMDRDGIDSTGYDRAGSTVLGAWTVDKYGGRVWSQYAIPGTPSNPDPEPEPGEPSAMAKRVASFLGQGDFTGMVALAEEHVQIITEMARAYTRDGGFDIAGDPNENVAAVIVTATARLLSNPGQLRGSIGGVQTLDGFTGWSLAETFVLNRYRKKAL